jgi:long-chain acyl-CoA synthetase
MKRTTIIDFVERYTREYNDLTFLREKVDGRWTETSFRNTREEAHKIGAGLVAMGLQKGDKVALLSQGRNLWITSELGILYAGGVNVPLSIKLTESIDLLFRIQHSESRYVIVSEQQLGKIRSIIKECPLVEKIIILDPIEDYQDNEISITDVIAMGETYLQEHAEEFKAIYESIGPDDYANISYTSGTTADPKGILLTHRNYTANVEQGASVIRCEKGDVMLIILPLDHCFAHVAGFYTMMSYGGSIATVPIGKTAIATLKNIPIAIKEVKPMLMLSVPALARNFRKSIETSIKAKGKIVERLYEFALNNAIKYNKPCGNIDVVLKTEDKNAVFKVRDTGIGIAPHHKDKIFQRFYVVDKSRNKNISSTGLGLSIVKHIVTAMNGTIELESAIGEGSQFTVTLPLKR